MCQMQFLNLVKKLVQYAPKIIQIQIDPQKIGDVVGQRGKTINDDY